MSFSKGDPGPAPPAKLKPFHWDKIPEARLEGTFWDKSQGANAKEWMDYSVFQEAFVQVRVLQNINKLPRN